MDYDYLYQEGNVIVAVVVRDSQEKPTIRVGNEEISIAQWNSLYHKTIETLLEIE